MNRPSFAPFFAVFVAVISFSLFALSSLVQPARATINPRFTYSETREHYDGAFAQGDDGDTDMPHVVLYPERNTFYMGENMRVKYLVRSPFANAQGLRLKVYLVPTDLPGSFTDLFKSEQAPTYGKMGWNSGGACLSPDEAKVKPVMIIDLPDIPKSGYHTGMFTLPVTAANGFVIKKKPIQNIPQVVVAIDDPQRTYFTPEMQNLGISLPCGTGFGPTVHLKSSIKTNLVVTKFAASQTTVSAAEFNNDKPVTFTVDVINKGTKQPEFGTTVCVVKRSKTYDAPADYSAWNGGPAFQERCKIVQPAQLKPGKKLTLKFVYKVRSHVFREDYAQYGYPDPDAMFAPGENRLVAVVNEGWEDNFETNYDDNAKEMTMTIQ